MKTLILATITLVMAGALIVIAWLYFSYLRPVAKLQGESPLRVAFAIARLKIFRERWVPIAEVPEKYLIRVSSYETFEKEFLLKKGWRPLGQLGSLHPYDSETGRHSVMTQMFSPFFMVCELSHETMVK